MFTGIIEELGRVERWERQGDSGRLRIRGPLAVADAGHGDSISVDGVCLTVVEWDAETFTVDVMAQTLAMSTVGSLESGDPVNLERAAQVGDRLGGHIVQGHIDGTARLLSVTPGDAWRVLRFSLPADLAPLVVDKGSIAVSGVSLTVSGTSALDVPPGVGWLEVSLIPETLTATTLGTLEPGDTVNIETVILARHVQRTLQMTRSPHTGETR